MSAKRDSHAHELSVPRRPRHDFAGRVFDRMTGSPLITGNAVRVLIDAAENYPAWLDAIRSAERTIFFENYIIEEDEVGVAFAEELAKRARAGVKVRLVRDWLGSQRQASRRYWRTLEEAGVETRVFNPLRLTRPLGWITRDHRKSIAVDGTTAFVSGLCVSRRWLGEPARKVPPWRDTGVELRGPAVAWVEQAFATVWAATGAPLPADALTEPETMVPAGDVSVRVIAGAPTSTHLFRLDQVIAAAAQRTLWVTDAYFVGFTPFIQALREAAWDGVDVRLLVPSTTDIPLVAPMSRAGYRPLLEAGVRIFEWNGSMVHAKTSVVDGHWARVGSSNLNVSSLVGNYELDVAIEDDGVAQILEDAYLRDLANSTEIVLGGARRARHARPAAARGRPRAGTLGARRPRVGAARFAHAVGAAAVSSTRALGALESGIERALAALLMAIAVVGLIWPEVLAYPVSVLGMWLAGSLILRAHRNSKQLKSELAKAKSSLERGAGARPR